MKKYIVITGASSGIGAATAKAFARRGENLILIARRAELLQSLKDEIAQIAPESDVVIKICDLARSKNVPALWDELKALINNAGFGDYGAVGERDLSKVSQMLQLNVISLTLLSHLFVRDYKRKPAQLINISSAGGYSMVPNAVTYCASKFFVSAFTEGLHRELAQDKEAKMHAKVLAPAATRTEFGPVATDDAGYDYDAAFKRYHSSEEMAEFLLALYDSDACVGAVDRNNFEFSLGAARFDYAGKR